MEPANQQAPIGLPALVAVVLLGLLSIPAIQWLLDYWTRYPDKSVGILTVGLSIWLIWVRRESVRAQPAGHSTKGLWLIIPGILLQALAILSGEFLLSGIALPMLLHGGSLWVLGARRTALLVFPFWLLALAFPFFDSLEIYLSFPMRMASTVLAHGMLAPFMEVTRNGTELLTSDITVAVIASCSGLNYLSTLFILGIVFSWLTEERILGRIILVALTPAIVLMANGMRIAAVAVLGAIYGRETALGFFHDFSGLLVFALAVTLLFVSSLVIHRYLPDPVGEETAARPRSNDDIDNS